MEIDFLDSTVLERLKLAIHEHSDFLIHKYSNFYGKKKISVLFSARDWLHIVVYGLPSVDLHKKDDDAKSLNVLQFVCTIDLLTEAVQQLYRALYNKKNYPLCNDKTVFKKSISDDQYFTHIRAAFGVHPVNLDSYDGVISDKKYFASWSSSHGRGDFSVYLYSNDPEESDKELTIYFNEIIEYAKIRYEYIDEITREIKRQQLEFNVIWSKKLIPANEDPLEQLNILKVENEKRYGDYGYRYDIEELLDLYTAPMDFTSDINLYSRFLEKIEPSILEIYMNLQNMRIIDLSIYPSPHYYGLKKFDSYRYDIQKIHDFFGNPQSSSSMVPYHLNNLIEAGLLPSFATSSLDKRDLKLIMYSYLEKEGASIISPHYQLEEEFNNSETETVYIVDDISELD
ncbi:MULTISPECIES: hypothetical protein [unclassified Sporosarcina]|uniref:hypothetical protein n=1 Tax=unclassified Sporosarcina TaxID=2647733 RepID=UPI001A919B4D|nr:MULTISPECIES: hypothetical protein [unclassified Sporosarcina]MBO0587601.1 hypothetical protein [Sporosarcina sp. E16_8]MBO0602411.1 hypothetical protein [Sporosarcina sp. E16_3]